MHSPPRPAQRVEHVRDRLGQHDVRGGDREPAAQRPEAARGGVDRQHRGAGAHAPAGASRRSRRPACVCSARTRERSNGLTPPAPAPRRPSASRAGWTVASSGTSSPRRKRGESQRARTPRLVERAHAVRAARRRGSRRSRRRARARSRPSGSRSGVNHASTPCSSHHAPIIATLSADARQTSSARSRPKRSTSDGRCVHSVSQKPPLRPLGPWPHSSASSSDDRRAARAQLPRRPQPRVAAADHDDVGGHVARQRAAPARRRRPPPSQ